MGFSISSFDSINFLQLLPLGLPVTNHHTSLCPGIQLLLTHPQTDTRSHGWTQLQVHTHSHMYTQLQAHTISGTRSHRHTQPQVCIVSHRCTQLHAQSQHSCKHTHTTVAPIVTGTLPSHLDHWASAQVSPAPTLSRPLGMVIYKWQTTKAPAWLPLRLERLSSTPFTAQRPSPL